MKRYSNLSSYSIDRLNGLLAEHYGGVVVLPSHIRSAIERILKYKHSQHDKINL